MLEFLTIPEASALLRWSPATIYSKISRRQLPSYRIGRSVRLKRSDLLKLFREVPALTEVETRPATKETE